MKAALGQRTNPLPREGTCGAVERTASNATVTALRFFFKVTLDRPETTRRLAFVYEPRKLPRVLSPEEVLRLLEAAPGPKHKAALSVAYGAGLRAMEVVALKVCDIDSKRMMLRVEQGKGESITYLRPIQIANHELFTLISCFPSRLYLSYNTHMRTNRSVAPKAALRPVEVRTRGENGAF